MDSRLIYNFATALGMKRYVTGVKFIFLKEEYEDLLIPEVSVKGTFCGMVGKAMEGVVSKAKSDSFSCQGGPEMLGMKPVSNYVRSGKQFSTFRLYESSAVSRQVQQDLTFIDQKIYGVAAGPLEELQDVDVVLFLCNGWQMMRVIQGYTYHNGMAKQIGMIGNQGICSDLVSRPYQLNDINISVLCQGARRNTHADDDEIGAGMPIQIFEDVAKGVIATINPAMDNRQKQEMLDRMDDKDQMGFEIELGKMYISYAADSKYSEQLYKKELY